MHYLLQFGLFGGMGDTVDIFKNNVKNLMSELYNCLTKLIYLFITNWSYIFTLNWKSICRVLTHQTYRGRLRTCDHSRSPHISSSVHHSSGRCLLYLRDCHIHQTSGTLLHHLTPRYIGCLVVIKVMFQIIAGQALVYLTTNIPCVPMPILRGYHDEYCGGGLIRIPRWY